MYPGGKEPLTGEDTIDGEIPMSKGPGPGSGVVGDAEVPSICEEGETMGVF